jgi:two-component sensor histidine kinase
MSPDPIDRIEAASTLAVIASSSGPLLFLNDDLSVIAASLSFCRAFQFDPAGIAGLKLSSLGGGEWDVPQLTALLRATASGFADVEAYEMDLVRHGRETRHLQLNAHKLDDGDVGHVRLLLAIVDVTVARANEKQKDALLREKAVLLQEVQHRVANSLQIIASVLMQSARRVQSEEARGYLRDAHHRVLSIAEVQRQLAASSLADVVLRPYFTQLCQSLGASMIGDHRQLAIEVTVDDSVINADASVSLGLIITELVINALKHAFPGHRKGQILVDFHTHGPRWTLSVTDDGVGMPIGLAKAKPGLGTGIVEALARQLHAEIEIRDTNPGTAVLLTLIPQLVAVKTAEGAV